MQGSHLYGVSPIRAGLKNIQSSNSGLDLNIKTLKNGGAFGFIHGKGVPLQPEQAKELKDRMKEMDCKPRKPIKNCGCECRVRIHKIEFNK